MTQDFRVDGFGSVDRQQPVTFTFDGKTYTGFKGDSLASALLANGVHLTGRSFKYHRPRGMMAAGIEEPNALVTVGEGAEADPNNRAPVVALTDGLVATSQNRFPSLKYDLGAINQLGNRFFYAGFYYKTFMELGNWGWNKIFEPIIRSAAGLGTAPTDADPDSYDKCYKFCDVLVAGGGPAGLMAALSAARTGKRVMLCEQDVEFGGSLLGSQELIDGKPARDWVATVVAELQGLPNVELLTHAAAAAYYDHNYIGVWHRQREADPASVTRAGFYRVRAKQVIIAAGAHERPLVFADNDKPGVMLANAARTYLNRYGVLVGRTGVAIVNNDSAYAAIADLAEAGADFPAVIDLRDAPSGPNFERARIAGAEILTGHAITQVKGRTRVSSVMVAPTDALSESREIICDFVLMSGGWNPAVHLHCQANGKLNFNDDYGVFVPGKLAPVNHNVSVGACNAAWSTAEALAQGAAAGGEGAATDLPEASNDGMGEIALTWEVATDKPHARKRFVDFQNDVTASDLKLALREGFESVEHVKRYTTMGMATDQGKTSNVNALGILSDASGRAIPEIGTTTFRPPYSPVTFGALAGRDLHDFLDVERTTPMHPWHVERGAAFEPVGQWMRAWYYPKAGEDLHAAVNRECIAVRERVGIFDGSTLGKIDVKGPDAAEFVNRVYSNAMLKLAIGKCRYGLMLGEDGMVMDDGIAARIDDAHFIIYTTTGGAANVMNHLEDYLQTEWTDLRVYLTSVTEQWATTAIVGPHARDVLAEVTEGVDLSTEAFPFMTWQTMTVAGVEARVFRISFSGEVAYEINVPSDAGLKVWEALYAAGRAYGITPYGTEAMHVLRAEKGFIIVGQETDGSMTPHDVGMGWAVSKVKSDFIGKRSLSKPDLLLEDRKQLVGVRTVDPAVVLPEGTHIVEEMSDVRPLPMLGFVSSSYWSAALGHSIALAMIKGGRERHGQRLSAPLLDGSVVEVEICDPVFYDKQGVRQHG